jgi:UrcA family protein
MRDLKKILISPRCCAALVGAGFALAGASALAQASLPELTVTGRAGEAQHLSQAVSYADLDLTRPEDQTVLKQRIADTAHDLCDRLGEAGPASGPLVPGCEDAAVREARPEVRMAIAMAPERQAYALSQAASADQAYTDSSATAPVAEGVSAAPTADSYSSEASATVTTRTITNGPVADTPQSRAAYGQPMSNAGRRTAPAGN